jgi:hypothetical protein
MAIVIKKGDSASVIKRKLEEAERKMKTLQKKEINELCGILKGKITEDPVKLIRKTRDEEWS